MPVQLAAVHGDELATPVSWQNVRPFLDYGSACSLVDCCELWGTASARVSHVVRVSAIATKHDFLQTKNRPARIQWYPVVLGLGLTGRPSVGNPCTMSPDVVPARYPMEGI
jgi:hypothetical protein